MINLCSLVDPLKTIIESGPVPEFVPIHRSVKYGVSAHANDLDIPHP
jgi:hypothetical protein